MNAGIFAASADSYTSPYFGKSNLPTERARFVVRIAPIQVHLFGEIPGELIVIQPFPINIERDADGSYVVSDDLFLVYGSGDDQSDAIHDYVLSLIEFYRFAEASSTENVHDKKQLEYLQTYIHSKSSWGLDDVQANRD